MSPLASRRSVVKGIALGAPAALLGLSAASGAQAATTPSIVAVSDIKCDTRDDGGTGGAVSVPISNKTPTFFSTGGVAFYSSGASLSVNSLIIGLVLPTKSATFDYAYGTSSADWNLPTSNSGKAKLADGSTGYLYEFVYTGKLAGTTLVQTPTYAFQVVSGGSSLLGSPFGGRIEAIVNGARQNRTSTTATVVRNGYSDAVTIGDGGVL